MKKHIIGILGLGVLQLVLAMPATAQVKIGTINLTNVFEGYYKTRQATALLKDRVTDLEKERKGLIETLQKMEGDYRKLVEGSQDQAVSSEEREKRKKASEEKLGEARRMGQSIEQFDNSARTSVMEQKRRKRDEVLKEIREVINAKAKAAGFTMVMDVSGESANNATPLLLYVTGENDLTDAVLKQLNATAPPGALTADPGSDKK